MCQCVCSQMVEEVPAMTRKIRWRHQAALWRTQQAERHHFRQSCTCRSSIYIFATGRPSCSHVNPDIAGSLPVVTRATHHYVSLYIVYLIWGGEKLWSWWFQVCAIGGCYAEIDVWPHNAANTVKDGKIWLTPGQFWHICVAWVGSRCAQISVFICRAEHSSHSHMQAGGGSSQCTPAEIRVYLLGAILLAKQSRNLSSRSARN